MLFLLKTKLGLVGTLALLGISIPLFAQESATVEPIPVEPLEPTEVVPGSRTRGVTPGDSEIGEGADETSTDEAEAAPPDAPQVNPATAADMALPDIVDEVPAVTEDIPLGPEMPIPASLDELSELPELSPQNPSGPQGLLTVGDAAIDGGRMFETGSLIPVRPDGFEESIGALPPRRSAKQDGFSLGASAWMNYDSNVHRSAFVPIGQNREDLVSGIAPAIGYRSQGSDWNSRFDLEILEQLYLENDNYGGVGYNFKGQVGYSGAKLDVILNASSALLRGGNRYVGGYLERYQHAIGVEASYDFSRKTHLEAGVDLRLKDPITGGSGQTETFGIHLAGLWRYSPLLEIGPGFRYRFDSGERNVDRSTYSPVVRAKYRLSTKVGFDGRIGVSFFDYANGASVDSAVFASLGLNYKASRFWSMNLSILNDSVTDESIVGAFRETFTVRMGVDRKIWKTNLGIGVSYESIERSRPTGGLVGGDTDSFAIDGLLTMPVLGDKAEASLFARWREQTGNVRNTWDSVQAGISLGYRY